jgi:hypothetical protein
VAQGTLTRLSAPALQGRATSETFRYDCSPRSSDAAAPVLWQCTLAGDAAGAPLGPI